MNEKDEVALHAFPKVVKDLPEADVPFKGVKAWFVQGEKHQLVFFEFEAKALAPEHSHEYDQWGIVVEGRMELTIAGKSHIIEKGDDYLIPARAKHSARFLTRVRVIDFFSEKNRYRPKVIK